MDLDLSKDAARLCLRGEKPRPISAMAFDPSSHLLALVIGPVVFVHEIPGGARRDEHRIKLPRPMVKEFTDRDIDDSIDPFELAFGCEGRRLAVLSELMVNNNGDAFRWLSVFETGVRSPRFVVFPPEDLKDLENTYGCRTWALSPDGATMVTYCEYELRLWDLATGASRDFPAPAPAPSKRGFSSDCDAEFAFDASGRHLAVASSGRFDEAPRVQIIEVSSGRVVAAHRLKDASPPMFPHLGFVAGPDGESLVATGRCRRRTRNRQDDPPPATWVIPPGNSEPRLLPLARTDGETSGLRSLHIDAAGATVLWGERTFSSVPGQRRRRLIRQHLDTGVHRTIPWGPRAARSAGEATHSIVVSPDGALVARSRDAVVTIHRLRRKERGENPRALRSPRLVIGDDGAP